jgi:hypothetical protein
VECLKVAGLRQQYKELWRQLLHQQQNQAAWMRSKAHVCVVLAAAVVSFYLMRV